MAWQSATGESYWTSTWNNEESAMKQKVPYSGSNWVVMKVESRVGEVC